MIKITFLSFLAGVFFMFNHLIFDSYWCGVAFLLCMLLSIIGFTATVVRDDWKEAQRKAANKRNH